MQDLFIGSVHMAAGGHEGAGSAVGVGRSLVVAKFPALWVSNAISFPDLVLHGVHRGPRRDAAVAAL
jgi:hypothetical protein